MKVFITLFLLIVCFAPLAIRAQAGEAEAKSTLFEDADNQFNIFSDAYPTNSERLRIINGVQHFITENEIRSSTEKSISSDWKCIGPFTNAPHNQNRSYTGRIVGIEIHPDYWFFLSASGGLWAYNPSQLSIMPISDAVPTLTGGAFAANPKNSNTIFLGTGEYTQSGSQVGNGAGVFVTHDLGVHWGAVNLPQLPSSCLKVGINPVDTNVIHIATNLGYFRSVNGGATFTMAFYDTTITDLVINKQNPNNIVIAWNYSNRGGILISDDGGISWTPGAGFPSGNSVGRISLAMCLIDSNILYASVGTANGHTNGIYKSQTRGTTWDTCSQTYVGGSGYTDFMQPQADYDNVISVSPTDCNFAIVGGTICGATSGAVCDFNFNVDANHVDQHAIAWDTSDSQNLVVYIGNDGGIAAATMPLTNFTNTVVNDMPISQIYEMSLANAVDSVKPVLAAATQDNGAMVETYSLGYWMDFSSETGDGFSIALNPQDPYEGLCTGDGGQAGIITNGDLVYSGNISAFPPDGFSKVRYDYWGYMYVSGGDNIIHISNNHGGTWTNFNANAFTQEIQNFSVSRADTAIPTVYVCLFDATSGNRLWVGNNTGSWAERLGNTYNAGNRAEMVVPDRHKPNTALLVMNNNTGSRLLKTTDAFNTWTDVTGDLPDAAIRSAIIYPYNDSIMIVGGVQVGCFRTDNNGVNWYRWNNGMPGANNMYHGFEAIDSMSTVGKFYVVAPSYGRSIWQREIHNQDTTIATALQKVAESKDALSAWFDGNGKLNISFNKYGTGKVEFELFDMSGSRLLFPLSFSAGAGINYAAMDGGALAPGVYLLVMRNEESSITQKIIKIK